MTGPFTLSALAFNPVTGAPAFSDHDSATGNIKCAVGTLPVRIKLSVPLEEIVRE